MHPGDLLGGADTDLECVADIWAADARAARAAAELAVWVARLARRRRSERQTEEFGPRGRPGRDAVDRRPPCPADVSETFVPELALIRGCTGAEAATLAVESLVLVDRLPPVWTALYEGRIDRRRAAVFVDLLGEVSPATAAAVTGRLLPDAGRGTPAQLRDRMRRVLARVDADALEARRKAAARRAGVRVQRVDEGLSAFIAELPTAEAHACAGRNRRHRPIERRIRSTSRHLDKPPDRPGDETVWRRVDDRTGRRTGAVVPTTDLPLPPHRRRFVRARDRRCRWPGCRRPPARHDLDHATPHADGGPTDCANLCCLCRTRHRIKTFAPGWAFHLLPDGHLIVRTPSGVTHVSTPPGFHPGPEPDPPWLDETAPPDPRAG